MPVRFRQIAGERVRSHPPIPTLVEKRNLVGALARVSSDKSRDQHILRIPAISLCITISSYQSACIRINIAQTRRHDSPVIFEFLESSRELIRLILLKQRIERNKTNAERSGYIWI